MNPFVIFLNTNGISQKEIADFFGVKEPHISRICHGASRLPKKRLTQLLTNDRGWDTSMLVPSEPGSVNINHNENSPFNNNYNQSELVESLRSQISNLQEIIINKDTQIDRLLKLLESK